MANLVPGSKYWIKRAENTLVQNEKKGADLEAWLQYAYSQTQLEMTEELDKWYQKYAKDNKMTLAEAKKKLTPKQTKDFNAQAQAYLNAVNKAGKGAFSDEYKIKLANLSAKAYVTKMDELNLNIEHKLEKLATGVDKSLGQTMEEAYKDGFYKTMYDVQKQTGFGVSFTQPGEKLLQAAAKEKWSGENYSDAIWKNKSMLTLQLSALLTTEFVRGKGSNAVAQTLAKALNVSFSNAKRIIRTEINYISNKGTFDAYKASGVVEEYEYVATLDSRTSSICRELDGQHFPLEEKEYGINFPPLHPYCRSTTIPYFPDDEISASTVDRVARDSKGKTYKIGKDVNFKDWVSKYADAQYAAKVKNSKMEMVDNSPKKLDFTKLSYSEFNTLAMSGATKYLGKYTQAEIMDAGAEWAMTYYSGIEHKAEAYMKYQMQELAAQLGVATKTDIILNPLIIDQKLNGYSSAQAFKNLITGQTADSIMIHAVKNPLKELDIMSKMEYYMMSVSNVINSEHMAHEMQNVFFASYVGDLSKTFFDIASKKAAPMEYQSLYKAWKDAYDIVGIPANMISGYIKGKYGSLAEAKQANDELFAKVKANKAAKQASGIVTPKKSKATTSTPVQAVNLNNMSQAEIYDMIATAKWFQKGDDANKEYHKYTVEAWKTATAGEKHAAWRYTAGSGMFNRPLTGYKNGWSDYNYVGPHLDLDAEGGKKEIANLYKFIDKCPIPETIKVRRGSDLTDLTHRTTGLFANLLQGKRNDYNDMNELINNHEKYEGQVVGINSFVSTGIAKDVGFRNRPVEWRIVLPSGTKVTYAEPYSDFGNGQGKNFDGHEKPITHVGSEAEMIVQAGTKFLVTKISKGSYGSSVFIELLALPESQEVVPDRIAKAMKEV